MEWERKKKKSNLFSSSGQCAASLKWVFPRSWGGFFGRKKQSQWMKIICSCLFCKTSKGIGELGFHSLKKKKKKGFSGKRQLAIVSLCLASANIHCSLSRAHSVSGEECMKSLLLPDENMAFSSLPGLNQTLWESHANGRLPQNRPVEQRNSTLISLSAWGLLDKITENL